VNVLSSRVTGSRKWQQYAFFAALLILVGGVIAAIVSFVGTNTGDKIKPQYSSKPPVDVSKVAKKVKLDPEAQKVARDFIATAVVRKNLAKAYSIVGPDIKENLTLKQWLTGDIPVVPYPADAIEAVPIQVVFSYRNVQACSETSPKGTPACAMLQVYMLPKRGANVRAQSFYLGLIEVGKGKQAHWVVNSWVPRGAAMLPNGRSS
jgi:hypothetical protein